MHAQPDPGKTDVSSVKSSKTDVSSVPSSGLAVRSVRRAASSFYKAEDTSALRKTDVSSVQSNGLAARRQIRTDDTSVLPQTVPAPIFKPFDERGEVAIYTRHLPHWRQEGATYAITFRLADSIPRSVLEQWEREEAAWREHHPEPWGTRTWVEYHTRFAGTKEKWLDQGHGECLLRQRAAQRVMETALRFFDRKRYHLDHFVIMPNHVHVIVQPLRGFDLTDDILKSWKQHTGKEINRALQRTGTVWMEESYDRIIRDDAELFETRRYIARNPAEAKLREGEFVLGVEERLLWSSCLLKTDDTSVLRGAEVSSARVEAEVRTGRGAEVSSARVEAEVRTGCEAEVSSARLEKEVRTGCGAEVSSARVDKEVRTGCGAEVSSARVDKEVRTGSPRDGTDDTSVLRRVAGTSALRVLLSFLFFGFVSGLGAQSALDQTLVFTGTTATAGPETYAWLVWQPSDPLFIASRNLAIYRKAGNAASASPYARISVVAQSADTRLIQSLLPVSVKLGQNLAELDTLLTEMLKEAMPVGTVTTAEKISALLVGAHGNPANMQRVILLGRQHPAIALCGGFGFADRIGAVGVETYELRDFDLASGADIGVLGRVTVDPASLLVLPAPEKPFEVKDESVKGHVNISMRWATPNTLRDLAPLQYGYDVYRVPKSTVLTRGWDATPPASVATLLTGAGVAKVNRLAVLPPALLDAVAATNPADTTTVFLNDDNHRFDGGAAFNDGQEFGWFAVARDLLGRGGQPSEVMLAMIHDRMPPNPPQHVQVRNVSTYNGTVRDQRFQIEWLPPDLPPGETISGYAVYRWRTPADIAKKGRHLDPVTGRPDANLIAILPAAQTTFTDNGGTAPPPWAEVDLPPPSIPADLGKTFYYSVRAFDGSVAQNLSGHSAPAWGVLRDREGPPGSAGGLNLRCFNPSLTFGSFIQVPLNGLTDDQGHFLFTCASTLPRGLDWAEFQLEIVGGTRVDMGRAFFNENAAGNLVAALRKTVPAYVGDTRAWCRVGTKSGVISDWVSSGLQGSSPPPQNDKYILALWNVALNGLAVDGLLCGWKHDAVDPVTGTTTDITGTFTPTLGSKEYKVYRRVDNSDQTLIASGTVPSAAPITWTDPSPPASNGTLCYFLQLFDEHGNAGPLVQQGECVESGDTTYMPVPMLEPITGTTPLNPRMKVSWFCNTAGVQRFEVWVARASGNTPGNANSGLSDDLASVHPNETPTLEGTEGLDFSVFETGLARHLTAGGEPHFSFTLPVSSSDAYTVMVRAVGVGKWGTRIAGAWSNIETFTFALRTLGLDIPVPWPDRPLPPKADFNDGITALHLNLATLNPWKGNAVRIGEYEDAGQGTIITNPNDNDPSLPRIYGIPSTRDVENYLYTNDEVAQAEPLESIPGVILPVALYRVQVTNAKYPAVPGDIVQVSPLMEQIAQFDDAGSNVVTDPFISILPSSLTGLPRTITGSDQDILLLDRQPVLKGARYKYLMVRFSPTKEIERVIVTNEIEVP